MLFFYRLAFAVLSIVLASCAHNPECHSNAFVDPAHCGTAWMRAQWAAVPPEAIAECERATAAEQARSPSSVLMTAFVTCDPPVNGHVRCVCVPTGTIVGGAR